MVSAIKAFAQWLIYGGLLFACAALLLLGRADDTTVERMRAHIDGALAPILEVLASPADAVANVTETVRRWLAVGAENEKLRSEVAMLVEWQAIAARLEAENAELRGLLNYVPDPSVRFIAARVISDPSGAFAQSILLNVGTQHSVAKGDVVMSGEGLVGRVVGVAPRAARVLLLTDLNSRIPVVVGPARVRAIVAGDNSDRAKLIHVEPGATITSGDRVVTSVITGAFPPGLPVGVVAETDRLDIAIVPVFERSRLEYVRIVGFRQQLGLEPVKPARTRRTQEIDAASSKSSLPTPADE